MSPPSSLLRGKYLMRTKRIKADGEGYYHVVSRIVNREYRMDDNEKDIFVGIMRRAEKFSAVDVLTFAVLDNHFHILVRVPEREDEREEALLERYRALYGETRATALEARWKWLRDCGRGKTVDAEQTALKRRMYDVSEFVKTLKMRYSISYNTRTGRTGTLWEGRFKSVLVEPHSPAIRKVATYIDLNAVRAKIVTDPSRYRWCGFGEACRNKSAALAGIAKLLPSAAAGEALREYRSWLGGQTPAAVACPARMDRFTDGLVLGGKDYVAEVGRRTGFARNPAFVLDDGGKGEMYALRRPQRMTA